MIKHDDQAQQVQGKVQVGDLAPDFTLPNQLGKQISLRDFRGKANIVLYFYGMDNGSLCTAEACAFRDSFQAFMESEAQIIGICSDSVESHQQFAVKQRLPFILLSDKGETVRKLYGVPSALGILPGRVTYVIDKQGIVRHTFSSFFAPKKHAPEALNALKALREERN
jgi:thioredoxin-dependent peroxiredoxin